MEFEYIWIWIWWFDMLRLSELRLNSNVIQWDLTIRFGCKWDVNTVENMRHGDSMGSKHQTRGAVWNGRYLGNHDHMGRHWNGGSKTQIRVLVSKNNMNNIYHVHICIYDLYMIIYRHIIMYRIYKCSYGSYKPAWLTLIGGDHQP